MTAQPPVAQKTRFIGPGTIAALVCVAIIGGWSILQKTQKPEPPRPVVSHSTSLSSNFTLPAEPDTERLLQNAQRLGLTPEQSARLKSLHAEWLKQSKPIVSQLHERTTAMQKYLNTLGDKHPTMDELQQSARPVSEASAQYARLRGDYQKRAIAVLTPQQAASWKEVSNEKRDLK
jgi:hypothetical protein